MAFKLILALACVTYVLGGTNVLQALSNANIPLTSCWTNTECKNLDWGFKEVGTNGLVKTSTTNGNCCQNMTGSARSGFCYWPSLYHCTFADDLRVSALCSKYENACGAMCCSKYERCDSYSEDNGFKVYKCVSKLNPREGFFIIGLPLILSLFTLALVPLTLMGIPGVWVSFDKVGKAGLLLSLELIVLAMLFFFSSAWQYGVTMVVTACLGMVSLNTPFRGVRWFNLAVHVALFLALLGWGTGNILISNWGLGLLNRNTVGCNVDSQYSSWFERSAATSAKWESAIQAIRANRDPNLVGVDWGYCGDHWWGALWVAGALCIMLSGALLIVHTLLLARMADGVGKWPAPVVPINPASHNPLDTASNYGRLRAQPSELCRETL